jgi:NitT/TauT family transport system substrate-binding protein
MENVRVGVHRQRGRLRYGPTLVALDKGYFAESGLDVELVTSGGRRGTIPALVAGELDVSPQSPSLDFFRAIDPKKPIKIVADHGVIKPGRGSGAIVARKSLVDSGRLRDYEDLKGLRIGLSPVEGDHDWLSFDTALKNGGLSFADVEMVTVDFGGKRHRALEDGLVDVATIGNPDSIAAGRDKGAFVPWKFEHELRPGRQQRAVMYGYGFWHDRPDAARNYLAAYLRGVQDYILAFEEGDGLEDVIRILCAHAEVTPEFIERETVPLALNADGALHVEGIRQDLAWFQARHLVSGELDLDSIIDESYLEWARKRIGKSNGAGANLD